jgi:superfamily II DNA or RNA helicase
MVFKNEDRVARKSIASEVGVVLEGPIERRGQIWYKVFFGGRSESILGEDLQAVGEGKGVRELFVKGAYGDEKSFSRLLTLARIDEPVRDTIYSYQASRTDLHGYQYIPLLKYLNSQYRRILIADEVGLGKTIEAGYIFQEERARQDLQRVLIVCPAGLRVKWQNEMYQRFGEQFDILRASDVRRRLASRNEQAPQYQHLFGIVSIETARSKQLREILSEFPPNLDFLIVDEVHHCRNRDTDNFRTVRILAENSDTVVFLSATPVHTGNDNLYNLMSLLLPERFDVEAAFVKQLTANAHIVRAEALVCKGTKEAISEAIKELEAVKSHELGQGIARDPYYPLVIQALGSDEILTDTEVLVKTQEMLSKLNLFSDVLTRTRKRDVEEGSAVRSAESHTPPLSGYEQDVYNELSKFIFDEYQRQYDSFIARFVLCSLQRQIASSLCAAVLHYLDHFGEAEDVEEEDTFEFLGIEESDFGIDDDNQDEPERYSLLRDNNFREIISSIDLERLKKEDTKYETLRDILSKRGKVIVFAFFKRSLRYLEERLSQDGIVTVRIDGDVPSNPEEPENDERLRRIELFHHDPKYQVLLSSQVGSEGLDFQFCDTIVNYDLPWNPMVVEQRIGRIDRLGQKADKVFIFNIVSKGTIEEIILARLYARINIFESSIGELEPILGEVIGEMRDSLFDPKLSREEKERGWERRAQALVREREHLRKLEESSTQLIAHDEVVRQKISKIRKLGRYLTGKELEIFVSHFLSRKFPTSELYDEEDGRPIPGQLGIRYFNTSPELRQFVAQGIPRFDKEGQRFRQLMNQARMKLVFDSESAMAHLDAEMIHSHHPFVKLISRFYEKESDIIHPVNLLVVPSTTLESGTYFYGWASIDERGTFNSRHLRMMLLNPLNGNEVTDGEQCEELLHEMVINGSGWEGSHPDLHPEKMGQMYDWFEDSIFEYASSYRKERNREAEAVVHRQLQSLEASYDVKRRRREQAIETLRAANRSESERMIPSHVSQVNKLKADYEVKRGELSDRRGVIVSHRIEGVGFVKVNG